MNEVDRLEEVVALTAQRWPDATAVATTGGADGTHWSYATLMERVARVRVNLHARGVGEGDRIVLVATPGPSWVAAFLGTLAAGAITVPLPTDVPATAIDGARAFTGARVVIGDRATGIREDVVEIESLLVPPRGPSPTDTPTDTPTEELAILAFTSGTMHAPRAVELTHANVLADLRALLAVRAAAPGDAFLSLLPPAHLFELVGGLLGPLASGASVVYPGWPLPNRIIDALRDARITHAMAVPALLDAVFAEVQRCLVDAGVVETPQPLADTAADISARSPDELAPLRDGVRRQIGDTLRTVVVGGAALGAAWPDVLAPLGIDLEVGYGLTEAGPVVSVGRAAEVPRGSVGAPLPGVDVRVDAAGEIHVRGANVMRGYHADPAATKAALVDGWLATGDVGRLEQGYLFIDGRVKDVIVTSAGETVHPDEVEPYYRSAAFAEWAVTRTRGDGGNDVPLLVVVPASKTVLDENALIAEVRRLRAAAPARCRVAELVVHPGALPRTATGKVRRAALEAACQEVMRCRIANS